MEWITQNWTWIAGAVVIVFIIYLVTRKPKKKGISEQEVGKIVNALIGALENVVDDAIGQHYTRQDRKKIALGMIAVMAADKISLEQLTSNQAMFAAVMAKSIATLTRAGEISTR